MHSKPWRLANMFRNAGRAGVSLARAATVLVVGAMLLRVGDVGLPSTAVGVESGQKATVLGWASVKDLEWIHLEDPNRPSASETEAPAEKKPPEPPSAEPKAEKPSPASEPQSAERPKHSPTEAKFPASPAEKEKAAGSEPSENQKQMSPSEIAKWIGQLGDDSYQVREQATAALCRAGLAATEALKAALKHPDLEVRRRARWILADILEADHRQRLEKFLADPTGSPDHPLPLWKRYRELVGHDEGARKLFAAMQRAEAPLLEAVEQGGPGGAESVRARLQQIIQRMQVPSPIPYQPSLGTSAAFLFVSSLPELELPQDTSESHYVFNLVHQQGFQQLLNGPDGADKAAARRLLGQWILRPMGPQAIQTGMFHNRLQLALQYRIPEGLALAVELLKAKEQAKPHGYMYAQAVCALGLLGGKAYAEYLTPLLDENQECTRIGINNKQITIEVRDVALAWLVHLTDQKHADYGMAEAAREFERLQQMSQYYPNFTAFRYSEGTNREEAVKKFKAWLAAHPLPKAPELPKLPAAPPKSAKEKEKEKQPEAKRANVLVVPLGAARAARANPPANPASEEQQNRQKFFLPRADRLVVRSLAQAQEALGQGRFAEAARILGEILADSQDYAFQPDAGEPLYRTLKSEAARLLAQAPPEGLQTYQTLYEPRAQKALQEAITARDTDRLLAAAENFFFTSSGAEAMYLLGRAFLDRGQPVQAALVFQRLRSHPLHRRFEPMRSLLEASAWYRGGELASAESALEQTPPELRGGVVPLAGRQEKLFTQAAEGIAWLRTKLGLPALSESPEGWLFVHSNPAHNPAAEVGPAYLQPLAHWPVCQEPIVARAVQQIRKKFLDELKPAVVQLYPLVVGRKVIFYTSTSLRAVDLDSGQLLWDAPMEDPLRLFLQPYRSGLSKSSPEEKPPADQSAQPQSNLTGRILGGLAARRLQSVAPVSVQQEELDETNLSSERLREILADGLQERFWGETTFGLSSSDGRRVYGLEDVPFRFPVQFQRVVVTADGRRRPEPVLQKSYNLLAAYDIQTGKAVWEVGGPPDVEGMNLAGAYFLGPPIPLAGRLYVVALIDEETRLLELVSETGQVLNQLAISGKQTEPNSHRAMLLAMGLPIDRFRLGDAPSCLPAYGEGVLVCRTAEHHYVGVDLLSRSVRWIYEAAQEEEDLEGAAAMFGVVPAAVRRAYAALKNQDDRWLEAGITIGEGCVLLTPPASNKLLCLRLADGHRLWTLPRRDGLFVAAVADGKAVVVGRESVWAVRLQDGQPAWSCGAVALPAGALPAGRGYRKGRYYYLPLTTAEVAAFDLEAGRLAARSRSPRGIIPGNLVACGQVILSQDVDGLYRWEILEDRAKQTAARLAQSPQDLQALLDHAESVLAQGQWEQCLELLERAKRQNAPSAQDQPRFQQLLTAAAQDAFLSDPNGFLAHLNQIEALWKPPEFQTQILPLLARAYHQQGQIETAFEKYLALLSGTSDPAKQQQRISALYTVRQDRWIAARLAELYQQASAEVRSRLEAKIAPWKQSDRLEEFVRYFGFHPDAQEARLQVAQRYVEAGRLVQAEWLLQTVFEQAQPAVQRLAAVRLAELYRKAGRHESVLEVYRLLSGPWADLPCADGKTGRQLMEALPADDPVRRLLAAESPWPSGPPKVEVLSRLAPMRQYFFVLMDKRTPIGPAFSFRFDPNQHQLELAPPSGRKGETVNIPRPPILGGVNYNLYSYARGCQRGHTLIAWLGTCAASVDLLSGAGQTLWVQPTASTQPQHPVFGAIIVGGRQQLRQTSPFLANEPLPLVVSSHTVCFQQERKLTAVEPLAAGQQPPLWTRSDLPENADLFGDEEVLFVTPTGQQEATVLSALDGRELGTRRAPDMKDRLLVLGRRILSWKTTQENCQAILIDPWTKQTVWSRSFPAKSRPWVLSEEGRLAVLAPSGAFGLVDLQTGQEVFHASVDPEPNLDGLAVLASANRYIVIANRPFQSTGPIFMGRQVSETIPVHGRLTALDRQTGQPLWNVEVLEQNFRLGFPTELPVLVFYNIVYKQEKNSRGDMMMKAVESLLCLDARTGQAIHQSTKEGVGGFWYEIAVELEQRTISIGTTRETIRLRFGEE